jgi:hypothetical protein
MTMQVYRFQDFVAVNPPKGETFYLTAEQARELEKALSQVSFSIKTEKFAESTVGTTTIDANGSRYQEKKKSLNRSYGFLEVDESTKKITVSYGGNMGNGMDNVRECFDKLYGEGKFDLVYAAKTVEKGDPSYMWYMDVKKADFIKIVG